MSVLSDSTACPHSLSSKEIVNAKGRFRNSSELLQEGHSPSARFLQLRSGRHREERGCSFFPGLSRSFLSNGLEMYHYANVNFHTEFKKRLLDFSFFRKKTKGPTCSHSFMASLFCNVNCNYAFCNGGRRRQTGRR